MAILSETYRVEGMSCTACAQSVESMLSSIKGIDRAEVNYAMNTVSVVYNDRETGVDQMKLALQSIGLGNLFPVGQQILRIVGAAFQQLLVRVDANLL